MVGRLTLEQGAPDARGETHVHARIDGRVVGHAAYGLYPHLLFVFDLALSVPHLDPMIDLIEAVAARVPDGGSERRFIHGQVRDPRMVLAYKSSGLGAGMLLSGCLGPVWFNDEPLLEIPDAVFTAADPATCLVCVSYDPPTERETVTEDELRAGLAHPSARERMRVLRASTWSDVPDAVRRAGFFFGVTDPVILVRRLAASGLAGGMSLGFATIHHLARIEDLVLHVDDPMGAARELGLAPVVEAGMQFDLSHARRNARYGLLWAMGVMATRLEAAADLRAAIAAELPGPDPARDVALLGFARSDLTPGELSHGIGSAERLGLLELARYVVLRHRAAAAVPNGDHDRFYWLRRIVNELVPEAGPADDPVTVAVWGASPDVPWAAPQLGPELMRLT